MSVHKFTVPDSDQIVEKWIANQSNYGVSIRMLIKMFVTEHGYQDVTCMAIGLAAKKRGRPSKQLMQKMEQMTAGIQQQYDTAYEDDVYDPEDTEIYENTASDTEPEPVIPVRPPVKQAVQQRPAPQKQAAPAPVPVQNVPEQTDDIMNMFNSPLGAGGNADTEGDDDDDSSMIDSLLT